MGVAARRRAVAEPPERDPAVAADLERERHAGRDGQHRGEMRDLRVEAELRDGHVHVPVAAARGAVLAAHVLREDPPGLDSACDVHAHVAVEGCPDVVRPHRRRDADGRRLVAAPGVEGAGDLPLLVEDVTALLDPPRGEHVAVDREEILAVEAGVLHLLERAHGLGFTNGHAVVSRRPLGRRHANEGPRLQLPLSAKGQAQLDPGGTAQDAR